MPNRVIVRGGGSIGMRHARVFASLGADVSVWPVRPRPDALDDITGAAALSHADLVVIATDTSRHVADTIAALDAGARRVLLEKPVAPTVADATALAQHPRADDVWVAAPLRAHGAFRHLLAQLPAIGSPTSAHVRCQSWLPDWRPDRDYRESYSARPDEGGVLRDLVHELDYATVLFGTPHLTAATLDHHGPLDIEAEQAATLLWQTDSSTVTCRLDYITRPTTRGITVHGPDGQLTWDVPTVTVTHTTAAGHTETTHFEHDLDRDHVMATQARAALELAPDSDPAQRHTLGCPATLAEGLATLELCDRAREIS